MGFKSADIKEYREFDLAREFARNLKLKNESEWRDYKKSGKLPKDIPKSPHHVYRDKGWISFGDWLGTGAVAAVKREYLPFAEARDFVRGLNLRRNMEWKRIKSILLIMWRLMIQ